MITPTDIQLLDRIKNNDPTAWDDLYLKYASVMLGAITIFTRNSIVAEKMLIDIFIELREKNSLTPGDQKLSLYLYVYSFEFTVNALKLQGLRPCVVGLDTYPTIIQQLCKKYGVKEMVPSEIYTKADLKIQKNTYCWLPIFGINPYPNGLGRNPLMN
jgi:hypothetical protein